MFIKVAHPFKLRTYFRPCYLVSFQLSVLMAVMYSLLWPPSSFFINKLKNQFSSEAAAFDVHYSACSCLTVTLTGLTLFFQCNLVKPNRKLRPCGFSSLAFSLFHSHSVFFPLAIRLKLAQMKEVHLTSLKHYTHT